jgi:hypothetical protein
MANQGFFFVDSDTKVTITGLQDENGQLLIATSTVVGVMSTRNTPLTGGTILFTYGGVPGTFTAYIPAALELTVNHEYNLTITITMPSTRILTIQITRRAAFVTA